MISEILVAVLLIFNPTMIIIHPQSDAFNTSSVEGLESFLKWSQVDTNEYSGTYNCVNFSSDLVEELNYHGFESSLTTLSNKNISHDIVSIKINDKIIFIEPQNDDLIKFNYLEKYYDNEYIEISIKNVLGISLSIDFNGYIPDDLINVFEV